MDHYNHRRLHSAIGYITPVDKLEGRAEMILAQREANLAAAREAQKVRRISIVMKRSLTGITERITMVLAGKMEAGSAEAQPAGDSPFKATNYRWGGSYTPAIPFYEFSG